MHKRPYHIAALLGSVRGGNRTGMALRVVIDELERSGETGVDLIDPAALHLTLPATPEAAALETALMTRLAVADAVVLATPEYHGSYSSVLKLLLDHTGYPSAMAGRPCALIGVAAGSLGAVKALEHLRSVCGHMGGLVLPYPVSIASVHRSFDGQGQCVDAVVEANLRGLAQRLLEYLRRGTVVPAVYEGVAQDSQ